MTDKKRMCVWSVPEKKKMEQLETEIERLKSKRHITLTQAREQALFATEKANLRIQNKEYEADNKQLRKGLEDIAEHLRTHHYSGAWYEVEEIYEQVLKGAE